MSNNVAENLNPLSLMYNSTNKGISVHLKSGEKYQGTLSKVDNYMNMVLEDTVEYRNENTAKFGRVFIRGNNVLLIKIG